MALYDDLRLPDLLAPIPGDSPVGPDLKYSNEFSEIEWAFNQGQDAVPPTTSPGFPGAEAEEHFSRVVELASDFLKNQSKDLRVASFLAGALLRVGKGETGQPLGALCFSGLSFGLDLLRELMEEYWDQLHSSTASRSAVLGTLGSDALAIPVRIVPLTSWGHSHFHFKDWSKDAIPEKAPKEEGALWAGTFENGLGDTDGGFYEAISKSVGECLASLEALEASCKEKFAEAGEPPPRFRDLGQALQWVSDAAVQLLEKKAPPPPEPAPEAEPEPEPSEASPAPEAESPAAPQAAGPHAPPETATEPEAPIPAPTPPTQSQEPLGPDQAKSAVVRAARVLREEDPQNPVPYLLLRGLRWGEVRMGRDEIDPQLLEAPTPEDRRRLRGLFLEENWEELLSASEEVMASEAGRGWMDIQRYSVLAADKLGRDFRPVTTALRGALRSILEDLPALAHATLMDDSAGASSDTLEWLEAAGFIEAEGESEDGLDPDTDTDPDKGKREASFHRAQQLVQGGDPDGAIRLLMRRADSERSERASFITRAEAAAIMVSRDELFVARPILDELLSEVDEHHLDDWEAGEVVARPLGLLFRCLGMEEDTLRQQVYDRICRLDPLLARTIAEDDDG